MVSIPACHAGDPGSIPGNGVFSILFGPRKFIHLFQPNTDASGNAEDILRWINSSSSGNYPVTTPSDLSDGANSPIALTIMNGGTPAVMVAIYAQMLMRKEHLQPVLLTFSPKTIADRHCPCKGGRLSLMYIIFIAQATGITVDSWPQTSSHAAMQIIGGSSCHH